MTVRLILVVGLLCVVSFFTKGAASEIPTDVGKSILSCPSGFVPAKAINVTAFSNSTSRPECICGQWGEHVHCNSETQEAFLQMTACMTYDANNNKVSVGHCHQGFYHSELRAFFLHLPPNITEVNQFMCGLYNREGFLCGRCKHGYGTAPFAKNFICKPCDGGPYVNWIKYIFAEFGPVTLLFIVMMFLQISVTSAFFNAFVFFAQIFMQPVGYRLAFTVLTTHTKGSTEALRRFVDALEMVYGVWNLEFFRPYIPPFCLVEGMSALQVVALEYITVFYPLMLIALSYILVQAHDWGFKPVRWCWKPFHACFARFRRSLDPNASISNAFATFLLLSYTKLIFTSFNLILFKHSVTLSSSQDYKYHFYPYYNPTVLYVHGEHIACFIFGTIGLIVAVLPVLLLLLYPCKFFQNSCLTLLTKHGLNLTVLHYIMDAFQGCYKDGTNNTHDFRYFAAIYFILRIVAVGIAAVSAEVYFVLAFSVYTSAAISFALVRPYREKFHWFNIIDSLMFVLLVIIHVVVVYSALEVAFAQPADGKLLNGHAVLWILGTLCTIPLLYITLIFVYKLLPNTLRATFQQALSGMKMKLLRRDSCGVIDDELPARLDNISDHSDTMSEYEPTDEPCGRPRLDDSDVLY